MGIFKKIFVFVLFFLIGILIAQYKIIPQNSESIPQKYTQDFYEDTLNSDNVEILKTKESDIVIEQKNGVYVPLYWKYGVNTDSTDYLLGYIPNIKNFKEYWDMYINLKYGIALPKFEYTIEDVKNKFENTNQYHITKGIINESEYFQWDNVYCNTSYSNTLNSQLYICKNWVNWTSQDLENKTYVLVECNLNQENGYCLFEDYLKVYYDSNRDGESRCFGEHEYYCEYTDYLNIISIN